MKYCFQGPQSSDQIRFTSKGKELHSIAVDAEQLMKPMLFRLDSADPGQLAEVRWELGRRYTADGQWYGMLSGRIEPTAFLQSGLSLLACNCSDVELKVTPSPQEGADLGLELSISGLGTKIPDGWYPPFLINVLEHAETDGTNSVTLRLPEGLYVVNDIRPTGKWFVESRESTNAIKGMMDLWRSSFHSRPSSATDGGGRRSDNYARRHNMRRHLEPDEPSLDEWKYAQVAGNERGEIEFACVNGEPVNLDMGVFWSKAFQPQDGTEPHLERVDQLFQHLSDDSSPLVGTGLREEEARFVDDRPDPWENAPTDAMEVFSVGPDDRDLLLHSTPEALYPSALNPSNVPCRVFVCAASDESSRFPARLVVRTSRAGPDTERIMAITVGNDHDRFYYLTLWEVCVPPGDGLRGKVDWRVSRPDDKPTVVRVQLPDRADAAAFALVHCAAFLPTPGTLFAAEEAAYRVRHGPNAQLPAVDETGWRRMDWVMRIALSKEPDDPENVRVMRMWFPKGVMVFARIAGVVSEVEYKDDVSLELNGPIAELEPALVREGRTVHSASKIVAIVPGTEQTVEFK